MVIYTAQDDTHALAFIRGCVRIRTAFARWAERAITANNPAIFALARHAAVMRATAAGSLKDAGQVVGLGCGAAMVGGDGLRGGFVGKGRGREKKEEESGGESFHGDLLRLYLPDRYK